MNYKILLLLILLVPISCSKEIEINIPDKEESLVVYSTLVPFTLPMPKSLSINLSSTKHIFDTTTVSVNDAKVFLYKNNELIDTVKYVDSLKTYPLNVFPKENEAYSIKVEHENYKTIASSTIIPSVVKIIDAKVTPIAYFDDFGGVYSEVAITFTDPVDNINYYELAISDIAFSYENSLDFYELSTNDNIITSENYYPSLIRFDVDKPNTLLFSDKNINGLTHALYVYYFPPQIEEEYRYINQHYITIHLRNVTEEYYKFKTTMYQHLYSKEEDILYGMGEPVNVISNIENGHGLFAGFNNDMKSLRIEKTDLIKK